MAVELFFANLLRCERTSNVADFWVLQVFGKLCRPSEIFLDAGGVVQALMREEQVFS